MTTKVVVSGDSISLSLQQRSLADLMLLLLQQQQLRVPGAPVLSPIDAGDYRGEGCQQHAGAQGDQDGILHIFRHGHGPARRN